MEQRSDQQSFVASSLAATAPHAPAPASNGLVVRRTLRLILRRALYAATRILRPLWRYAPFVAVVAVLLGTIGWLSFQLWSPTAATTRDLRTSMIPPSSAVENYIQGRRNFNADLMWSTLSSGYQAQRMQNGESKSNLQAQYDKEKTAGVTFLNYDYIGGVNLEDGSKMYFYATKIQLGSQKLDLPTTFRVDQDGKVQRIYAIEPAQLMSGN